MSRFTNTQGQPIGAPLWDWSGCPDIPFSAITGTRCNIVALLDTHAPALHAAFAQDETDTLWTYMPNGPFRSQEAYTDWVREAAAQSDPLFFAIIDKGNAQPVGVASYLRIQPLHGVVEVGWITFAPALKRTAMATEAMYLMMKRAFDLGYRRYEWKCDALNAASRKAAERFGFTYEGTFRQAVVYKGRNRDTAWYAITNQEWPKVRAAFEAWLEPANFDANGVQRSPLRMSPAGV